jgi:hypothetical protein
MILQQFQEFLEIVLLVRRVARLFHEPPPHHLQAHQGSPRELLYKL